MSPFLGYAALGVGITCFSSIAFRLVEFPNHSPPPPKTWVVLAVGLAAIIAVGLSFGVLSAAALLGFAIGSLSVSEEDTIIEKIRSIACPTLALGGIVYLCAHVIPSYGFTVIIY